MKKAIRENIEFITDHKILKSGADSKQYQYSLVSVSFAAPSNTIVNHFNISTIKKRIIMMNTKRSSKAKLTRYALLVPAVVALLLVFSISKAALTRDKSDYKTMAATFNRLGIHVKTGKITKPSVVTHSKTVMTNVIIKTAPFKTVDTTRKGDTFISTTTSSDTLTYVINGKKVTKAAFKALDPDQIYAIEIVTGEAAAKIIDNIDSKHDVLFVTTDDSDAGKKFKEKLDKLNGNVSINYARPMSVYGFSQSRAPGSGYSGGAVIVNDSNSFVMHYSGKKLKLDKFKALPKATYTITTDSLYTNEAPVMVGVGSDSAAVYELRGDKSRAKLYTYKVRPYVNQAWGNARTMPNKTFLYSPKAIIVNDRGFNKETNIDHLSSRTIIIDGKVATESDMKKLSAADIESMSVKSGDEITKKYGNKAKNGVVFIMTKKK
jgi:bla regulator protein BlaR1